VRGARALLGVLLVVAGTAAAGLIALDAVGQVNRFLAPPPTRPAEVAGGRATMLPHPGPVEQPPDLADPADGADLAPAPAEPALPELAAGPPPSRWITCLGLPRIGLETEVVPAPFVLQGNEGTWEVPPFVAGHAEFTAGAGEAGNAIVLGHVTSITLGNVFETLDRARIGDVIQVASGDEEYAYQVTEVRRVSRTDVSVLDPAAAPTVSLITCTGLWLPHVRDYAERLVVRGELVS
jgi:LPXTG-site transpeptidase (sortase) family protein